MEALEARGIEQQVADGGLLLHVWRGSSYLSGLRVHAVAVGRALHPALQVHRAPGTDRPPPPGAGVWAVVAEQGFAAVYVWYLCALCVLLQYDYAFRFVSSCVSDTDLTPEEGQVHRHTDRPTDHTTRPIMATSPGPWLRCGLLLRSPRLHTQRPDCAMRWAS